MRNLSSSIRRCRDLTSMHVFKNQGYINGNWLPAKNGETYNILNPATGDVITSVPDMTVDDTKDAIIAATNSFKTWQLENPKKRSQVLRQWFNLLEDQKDDIAEIMSAECGKPFNDAKGEITYGNSFIEWYSEEIRRVHGEILSSPNIQKHIFYIFQPIGVAALITPWNFPHAMLARKAAAAISAGCTCVVKPASDTPLTALAMAQLAEDAGIPKGVFNIVTSGYKHSPDIGKELCESPLVAGLSFTGSTAIGKVLYKQCASTVKRISLELGGNAPFIVFSSADIKLAVKGAMTAKFRNCGQTCVAANRFLIHKSVYDEFIETFANEICDTLKMGHGMDPDVNLGPLINETHFKRVSSLVDDAVCKGAKVIIGGKPAESLGKLFYEPTILVDVNKDMDIYSEEIFGPVSQMIKFDTDEEAIQIANDTDVGLAAYFYSQDISQIMKVARFLEVGMIGVNDGLISTAEAPFGGVKQSGFGREGSQYGVHEYTYIKYLCLGTSHRHK